jgi:glycosyltransferase involved in cell wall biosynthesis
MTKPLVSVLIDTYNHERFIEQAIVSVLEQDVPAAEMDVLVVDDGSTDNTPAIVQKFGPRVRYLRKANGGQASAFNVGIPETCGEIIAFLDGDDWWAPGKLRRVVDAVTANPALGMVGHGFIESFDTGMPDTVARASSPCEPPVSKGETPVPHQEKVIALGSVECFRLNSVRSAQVFRLRRCYFGTSRLTLRGAVARKILPVPEAITIEADEFLFTMAARLADLIILPEPLTHYRVHGGNLFLAAGGSVDGLRRKQRALAALATALNNRLLAVGVPEDMVRCTVEIVEAEAAQLRLALDGGSPLETYRAEETIYRIQHGDASWPNRLFRHLSMVPALLLPPRWFYGARRWLSGRVWYNRARKAVLPVPGFTKTTVQGTFGSKLGLQ